MVCDMNVFPDTNLLGGQRTPGLGPDGKYVGSYPDVSISRFGGRVLLVSDRPTITGGLRMALGSLDARNNDIHIGPDSARPDDSGGKTLRLFRDFMVPDRHLGDLSGREHDADLF